MIDTARPAPRLLRQAVTAGALGSMAGLGFLLPVGAYHGLPPGPPRTVGLVVAAIVAILLIRRASRLLRPVLDAAPREWRIVLLGVYGLVAMGIAAIATV